MTSRHQSNPTVGSVALGALRRHPTRTAFVSDHGTLTYAATLDRIGRFQAVLQSLALPPGTRVAILSGNRAESWCTAVALWCSDLAVTYLHPMGSAADQRYQIENAEAAALVVDADRFADRAGELASALPDPSSILTFGPAPVGRDLLHLAELAGPSAPVDVADPEGIAWLNYTGGTTGRPKGVIYRHRSVLSHTRATLSDFELPRAPRYLAVAPITHVAGTKILPTLLRGGTVHLQPGFDPERVLRTIEQDRITLGLLVPTMIYTLLDHPDLERRDLSSLELLLYGASPIAQARLQQIRERLGDVVAQLYGQSECYPISYLSTSEHASGDPELLASCGVPVLGTQVAILDDEDQPVAPGEPGEICVRGPSVMDGYHQLPELTAETLAGGWLHTGDIGVRGDRGHISIVDRKKDMVVSGGFNVYPREVEDALSLHPAVATSAVYGVPDERWGESVRAAVVVRPGVAVTPEELIAHVRELKGPVQAPKEVTLRTDLPLTPVGKIDKVALRSTTDGA